ncbi:MAG: hypothetical protein JJ971_10665 [Balneolaceae bacterium]|nr:hypothetical protein [Balneolaceae bacterium]MBO6546292.1 hypothetical protein [Balneolaceae bacterium]MBO6648651.1 hypothetical protein [Balneolaceae bacterium]
MKTIRYVVSILMLGICINFYGSDIHAQTQRDASKTYLIIKNDGSRYTGKIISEDAREVTLLTSNLGEIAIPKHEIREIRELEDNEVNEDGSMRNSQTFATRYFLSTNGLGIDKGENYIIWNLFGPDAQFGVSDNVSLGIVTTWFGTPILGSVKYSYSLSDKAHLGFGTLLGTGSWTNLEAFIGLPFVSITTGDTNKNFTLSAGYGFISEPSYSEGSLLFSVAGMTPINDKLSFVFDSYFLPLRDDYGTLALIIPGLRFQTEERKAFQLGFAGVAFDGELAPFPFPMIQWFRKL